MRRARATCSSETVARNSQMIFTQIIAWPVYQHAQQIACYASTTDEVQTDSLLKHAIDAGKRIALPRRADDESGYRWAWLEPDDGWREGAYGIREPAHPHAPIDTGFDLVLIPALAVDLKGHRLGHGRGHIDRLLSEETSPIAALVFAFQICDEIPAEIHDRPVDFIISENGLHTTTD